MTESPGTIEKLIEESRLVAQAPDKSALAALLEEAEHDIVAADANLLTFGSWADAMLYESGLRSARAIVQAAGYRIVACDRAHVTTIDAADALTGGAHHAAFIRLHRMRRRRNEFMYAATAEPTASDTQQARQDASLLSSVARQAVADLASGQGRSEAPR